jgi:hypothetical protein
MLSDGSKTDRHAVLKLDAYGWPWYRWHAPNDPFEACKAASTLLLVAVSSNASVGGRPGLAWKVGAVERDEVCGTPA